MAARPRITAFLERLDIKPIETARAAIDGRKRNVFCTLCPRAEVAARCAKRSEGCSDRPTFAAEIGDVRRFETPRQLMSFLGLVPAESSTGETVRHPSLSASA
jgi:hypothetical protein